MATLQDLSIMDRNPIQEQQYQQMLKDSNIPFTVTNGKANVDYYGSGGNGATPLDTNNPMLLANQAQQMQLKANQPAIATLSTQKQSLSDSYKSLLDSVLGQGTAATNQATTAENNLLAQRGITSDSPLYGKEMSSALIPVSAANMSAAANVGMGSAQDINTLAGEIAGLQAGNVQGALGAGQAFGALGLQSALLPAQLSLLNAQAKQQNIVPIPGLGVYDLSTGQLRSNTNPLGLSPSGRTIVGNF